MTVRYMNEQVITILKGVVRQAQANSPGANLSTKRILQMRNQGLLKGQMIISAALRPLYQSISKTLKNLDQVTIS